MDRAGPDPPVVNLILWQHRGMTSSVLTDDVRGRINDAIRAEVSPRHVPDEIIVAPGIPHTRTGKKLEVPIKKLFQGGDAAKVVERSAVDDPDLLDWYVTQRRK